VILQTDVPRCRFGIAVEIAVRRVTKLAVLEQRVPGTVADRNGDGLDTVLPDLQKAVYKTDPHFIPLTRGFVRRGMRSHHVVK